jgi:hypothetical protein
MEIKQLKNLKSQKGYKFNDQFFVAYEGNPNFDPSNEDYKDCLEYIKNGGIVLPEFTPQEALERAKAQKINELNAFIFAEKTKPYTTFTAPELVPSIVNGKTQFKQGEPVSFIWYVDAIPNSKLTPESILNKCNLDMTTCIKTSILDAKSIDLASLKTNLKTCLDSKIIPYTTTITKNNVQSTGMVNVFPIAESLANHIQQREVNSNVLNNVYLTQINNCKTVPEVEAIKFTTGA